MCTQQGDIKLSDPPSGVDARDGARTRDRRVLADLRAGLENGRAAVDYSSSTTSEALCYILSLASTLRSRTAVDLQGQVATNQPEKGTDGKPRSVQIDNNHAVAGDTTSRRDRYSVQHRYFTTTSTTIIIFIITTITTTIINITIATITMTMSNDNIIIIVTTTLTPTTNIISTITTITTTTQDVLT
ncbi:hypothetical protein PoB_000166400 [Plakobranchus ocellatus]|uniref:Uncharacterized protein n=1 Tax=Plakobranchus ocellatus TaxID=259542 RepID=A0AAV3XZK2_9GAST|nr:hypothetical protein PoB_000166400 [Plakobranchus ocellatus]